MPDPVSILSGLKVIDCGTFVFGPAATTVLADFGADVIKIEPPGIGDPYRYLQKMPPLPDADCAYGWQLTNRNKRGIVVNLKCAEGQEVLHRLARSADVFVTNYHPSVLRAVGATYEELEPLNARLVYAQASGYGEHGEEIEKPGYDATAWWARSGLMDVVREADSVPALSVAAMGDHPSAMTLVAGILLALLHRERSGKGTKVSSSLLANGAWANAYMLQGVFAGAPLFQPITRNDTPNALVNRYQTSDGRWILLAMVQEQKDWPRLPVALSRPDLLTDSRFETLAARRANAAALVGELDAIFASKDLAHWREALDRNDITFGVVGRLQDADTDRQMIANGILPMATLADGKQMRTVDSPLTVACARKASPGPAPNAGQHSDEVLAELGFDVKDIAGMRERGAIC
ncbi:MAG TPA: CaiB/BaiF CoA-transferase family protein [Candidatus Limnocylindrales bacterium]|nr:CaiB/BaiF CoA-transferase family protein [Candidatus Limnocylindrales bacterium]